MTTMEEAYASHPTVEIDRRGSTVRRLARLLGELALVVLVADGLLSATWGRGWLEWQVSRSPSWYARVPAKLLRLPDPALRAVGLVQTAASAAGLTRLT